MKIRLLDLLCCPYCGGFPLHLQKECQGEILEGSLVCSACGMVYPITRGVPRMTNDRGVESFSREWTLFHKTQLDSISGTNESLKAFATKTGFNLADMNNKLVLDAGCGSGRYMETSLNQGAEVVGIDSSLAVDASYANLGGHSKAHIVQADINKLPFADETFDYIFSLGVLHHTPNTRVAFSCLPKLLKPKGQIAVWIYSAEGNAQKVYNLVSNIYRVFTTKLSFNAAFSVAKMLACVYPLKRVLVVGRVVALLLPSSDHPDKEWRVLDNFDWYTARYQWKHTYREVERWFEECGLEYRKLPIHVSVWGEKHG